MHEALLLAKNELGESAVVLNTKRVKAGGVLGIGGGEHVELMAAIDDAPVGVSAFAAAVPRVAATSSAGTDEARSEMAPEMAGWSATPQEPSAEHLPTPFRRELEGGAVGAGPVAARTYSQCSTTNPADPQLKQLWSEVFRLTSVVESLAGDRSGATLENPEGRTEVQDSLAVRLGIDSEIACRVMPAVGEAADIHSLTDALLASMAQHAAGISIGRREVIALVGPTGVGKTTTLAKLAAKFALEEGKKVALVTADTFRIGAVEQLRTYARIMGVPVETALSPEEIAASVAKHADKDVVLIDTVGRSQRSTESLAELKAFIDAACPTQVHLVISASSSSDVQREVLEKFAIFGPSRLIVTKIDEAPLRGCLVNLPVRSGIPVSCVTAGQNVPHDIDFALAATLAGLVTEVA